MSPIAGSLLFVLMASLDVATDYSDGPTLGEEAQFHAVQLARQMGQQDPAMIRTYYFAPSEIPGIAVVGRETRQGREVSYRIDHLIHIKWRRELGLEEMLPRVGPYLYRTTQYVLLTVLGVGNQSYRLRLDPKVPPEVAEDLLEAVLDNRFTLSAEVSKRRLDVFNFSNPQSLHVLRNGDYSLSFACRNDPWGECFLELGYVDQLLVVRHVSIVAA